MQAYQKPSSFGIIAVDAVGYTRNQGRQLPEVSRGIMEAVEISFGRAGLGALWEPENIRGDTGDGCFVTVPENYSSFLVPMLSDLQHVLEERAVDTAYNQNLLRLRVALGFGSVPDEPRAEAVNDTFRLLDSDVIKAEVEAAHPHVTLVFGILSERYFKEIVTLGYSNMHPAEFRPVEVVIPNKEFAQRAYMYVPRPSISSRSSTSTGNAKQFTLQDASRVDQSSLPVASGPVSTFNGPVTQSNVGTTSNPQVLIQSSIDDPKGEWQS
ncbi:hypothetical protein [Nocardia thraciensis]